LTAPPPIKLKALTGAAATSSMAGGPALPIKLNALLFSSGAAAAATAAGPVATRKETLVRKKCAPEADSG
jgi:hypothetical protein